MLRAKRKYGGDMIINKYLGFNDLKSKKAYIFLWTLV